LSHGESESAVTAPEARSLAEKAAAAAGVEVHPLMTLGEAQRVVELIRATWGEAQSLPLGLIRALQSSGNPPIGAMVGEEVVGFALGFLGPGDEGVHLHSHMAAVAPDRHSAGIGYAIKLAQRAAALDAGVRVARWTFDPLQARNAYLNLHKLGAVADRFHRHFYGDMDDALNRRDRSDRLEARWDLDAKIGHPPPEAVRSAATVLAPRRDQASPWPGEVLQPSGDLAFVRIPPDYGAIREQDPGLAAAWREATAQAIESCIASGMVGTDFLRDGVYVFRAG